MKRLIYKGLAVTVLIFAMFVNAAAAEAPKVGYDYSGNRLTISGTAENDYAVFQIMEQGNTEADITNTAADKNIIFYTRQINKEQMNDGKYIFDVRYAEDGDDSFTQGEYTAYLFDGKERKTMTLHLYTRDKYAEITEAINEYAKASDFTNFDDEVRDGYLVLTLDKALLDLTDADALEICMEYIAEHQLDKSKSDENKRIINRCTIMNCLKNGAVSNIHNHIDGLIGESSNIYADYRECISNSKGETQETRQIYLTEKMKYELPSDYQYDDFEMVLKQAVALATIKYADGYADVKRVLTSYKDELGITVAVTDSVCRQLLGNDYTVDTLKSAIEKVQHSGSSGSIGTGGSLGLGGSGGGSMVNIEPVTENRPEKLNVYFNDIDDVEWAHEAIIALAHKGIINGVSEGIFKPNDSIAREEFVKILVGTMEYADEEYTNVFADVNDNDWFVSYVNIANQKGIVNGIGDGRFGAGQKMTRQDMAVMLYNALKIKNNELPSGELIFEDSDSIADYAIEAVKSLVAMGAVNGMSETRFEPQGTATRAQAAKVIYGVFEQLSQK